MFAITQEILPEHLEHCHLALMRVWNQYRAQMYQRGFETADATQEVAASVWKNLANFKGTTPAEFCAWSRTILTTWILAELRRKRPGQMVSNHDEADSGQERPSEGFQKGLRYAAYQLARAALPEHQRILIELRYEQALSLRAVGERLRNEYPHLWRDHQAEWDSEYKLGQACKEAEQHINKLARKIYGQLEGGIPR